jgi:maltooligosyltrehalose trehalohydrolase
VHDFSVWAPVPSQVDVVVDGRPYSMDKGDTGWWHRSVPDAGPGCRYGFRLDGGEPRPDPRSASQPDGVHGLSEVIDHRAYAWTDPGWRGVSARGMTLYELHIGTFTPEGTFDAAIGRLEHLVQLGVDAVEVMPIAEFPGRRGWGYDGVDLYAPHHGYGGPDGFVRFVDACHSQGLGVVLDVVYNHLGPDGNYLAEFGPYFSSRHQTNWGDAVNFDGPGSDEVRRFVIDNALMWLDAFHVDGLRLDAVHAFIDDSAQHILEQLAVEVDALAARLGRSLFLVAESDRNDPRLVRSRDAGGFGLDGFWADEWHHALHAVLTGETDGYYEDFGSLSFLAKAVRQAWVYDGTWSPHRQRHHGGSPAGLAGHRFTVFDQNHDQVGNRAAGERIGAITSPGRLKIAAALLLTSPFTPMLFQGEEWGATTPFQYFTDHDDPQLSRAVSEGRRREFERFGWAPEDVPDPQSPDTWARSQLNWRELDQPEHREVLDWYRKLMVLRRRYRLADPRLELVRSGCDEERGTLWLERATLRVLVNLGPEPHTFPLAPGEELVLASGAEWAEGAVILAPDAVAVLTPCGTPLDR